MTQLSEEQETSIVKPMVQLKDAVVDLKAFQDLKAKLLSSSDYQSFQGKNLIKKSGWRKLALVFNISDEVMFQEKLTREDGSFVWNFRVRARAPNGRYTEAVGCCDSKERKFAHVEHDILATAHTRAKSRAISDLIGAGEVSAEEMDHDSDVQSGALPEDSNKNHRVEDNRSSKTDVSSTLDKTARSSLPLTKTQSVHPFNFELDGKPFPMKEAEEPLARFFVNKVCKGIVSNNPKSKYEFLRNSSNELTGIIWRNIDEKEEKEIANTLQWTIKKVEQNRREANGKDFLSSQSAG